MLKKLISIPFVFFISFLFSQQNEIINKEFPVFPICKLVPVKNQGTCFNETVAEHIEKHFILDRSIGGPDASFSMNEKEFANMVTAVREAEKSIGRVDFTLTDKQIKGKDFSRSLYIVNDIKKGDVLTKENIRSIRPGFGLHPKYLNFVLGKK